MAYAEAKTGTKGPEAEHRPLRGEWCGTLKMSGIGKQK